MAINWFRPVAVKRFGDVDRVDLGRWVLIAEGHWWAVDTVLILDGVLRLDGVVKVVGDV